MHPVRSVWAGLHLPDTPNEVAITDAGGSEEHALPCTQICCVQDLVQIVSRIDCALSLIIVTWPQPPL